MCEIYPAWSLVWVLRVRCILVRRRVGSSWSEFQQLDHCIGPITVNSQMAANWSDPSRMLCRRGERKPKPQISFESAVSKHEGDNREFKKKMNKVRKSEIKGSRNPGSRQSTQSDILSHSRLKKEEKKKKTETCDSFPISAEEALNIWVRGPPPQGESWCQNEDRKQNTCVRT